MKSHRESDAEMQNRVNISEREKYLNFFIYFVFFDIILKWVAMYTGIRNGVISSIILMAYIGFIIVATHHNVFSTKVIRTIDLYIFYNFLMAIVAWGRGYSIGILLSEAMHSLGAIFAFFAGYYFTDKQAEKFENIFCWATLIILVAGIYYNLTLSDPYYIAYLYEYHPNFYLANFYSSPRLTSFIGSVVCGTYGCVSTCFAFSFLERGQIKKFWIFSIVGALSAFLSLQRSAIVGELFVFFVLLIRFIKHRQIKARYIVALLILIVFGVMAIQHFNPNYFVTLFGRLDKLTSAVSERAEYWSSAFSHGIIGTIFGYGFATGGQRAIGISSVTINDGNYFMIIYDIGLVGLCILLTIIAYSIMNGIKSKKKVYLIGLLCFMFQMIGSNLLIGYQTAFYFWYFLGRLNARIAEENELEVI